MKRDTYEDLDAAQLALDADETLPWNVEFWFGGFDGDAYVQGTWDDSYSMSARISRAM